MKNPFGQDPAKPTMPNWLADEEAFEPARLVWRENLERVVANGCTDRDSDLFARYCCLEAWHRSWIEAMADRPHEIDGPPSAEHIEALLHMAERLGLAGPSSRKRESHVHLQQL